LSANRETQTIRLAVKVTPNTGRNEVTGFKEDVLQVRIAAPPEKGKANKELVDFLSDKLGVKKSSITITRGPTSRNKVLAIEGIRREQMIRRLSI
jgi:uncharacterized protein (TIGR00251 family)